MNNGIRLNVYRENIDFNDLLSIIAEYYRLYVKAYNFASPWIFKQSNNKFSIPSIEQLKNALGEPSKHIHYLMYTRFVDSVLEFIVNSKGKRAFITPDPTTLHSAQFGINSFFIKQVDKKIALVNENLENKTYKNLHAIYFFGTSKPVYVENLRNPESIKFIILRPKLGKLAIPSTNKWEVMLYKDNIKYLISHVDSDLNPKWAGVL